MTSTADEFAKEGYLRYGRGTTPANLMGQLQRDEGLRLKPYKCTGGKTTIGYGRNLDDVGITTWEANSLLSADINRVMEAVQRRWSWVKKMNEARAGVLYNMAFNIGIGGLAGFRNMLSQAEMRCYSNAAAEMLDSRWAKQVGERAIRLADQMRTGEWR